MVIGMSFFFVFITLFISSINNDVLGYPSEDNIIKPLGGVGETVENLVRSFFKAKTPVRNFPDSGRTKAVLELQTKESIPNQLDEKSGNLHEFLAGIFNPKPIVDITEEHEKYGNDGSKGRKIATVIIGGYEGLSNGLNAAVEFPFVAAKEYGKKLTSSLNIVGGKLVGLSK